MSGPEGVAVWSEIAGTVWWFTDQAVARAYPDGVGGVVFQTSGEAEAGPRCHPIWRLEGPDAEPEVIHSGPDRTESSAG